jgi:hypothetical protein
MRDYFMSKKSGLLIYKHDKIAENQGNHSIEGENC